MGPIDGPRIFSYDRHGKEHDWTDRVSNIKEIKSEDALNLGYVEFGTPLISIYNKTISVAGDPDPWLFECLNNRANALEALAYFTILIKGRQMLAEQGLEPPKEIVYAHLPKGDLYKYFPEKFADRILKESTHRENVFIQLYAKVQKSEI